MANVISDETIEYVGILAKLELSEDEKNAIKTAANDFIEANSKEALNEMGADKELVEELLTLFTIKQKMYDAIVKPFASLFKKKSKAK